MPEHQQQGDVAALYPALDQIVVQRLQQQGWVTAPRRHSAQQSTEQRAEEGRGYSLSAHVAECDHYMIFAVLEEIVSIATDLASGAQSDVDVESLDLRGLSRKQQRLQL